METALQLAVRYGLRKNIPGYESWANMKRRCNNPSAASYMHYGFRDVTYDKRWESFDVFIADMGIRPEKGMSLDRIDGTKGYSKDNCRWATQLQQVFNRKETIKVRCCGMIYTTPQIAAVVGVSRGVVRLWTLEPTFKCRITDETPVAV